MSPLPDPDVRDIFSFRDGDVVRYTDPHRVRRLLHAHLGGSLEQIISTANSKTEVPPPVWSDAWEHLVAAVIIAFDLMPFDPATGKGATENWCRQLLTDFFSWEGEQRSQFPV